MEHIKKYWGWYALGIIVLVVIFAPKKWNPASLLASNSGTGVTSGTASGSGRSRPSVVVSERVNCVTVGTRTCCRPGGPAPTQSECENI